MPQVFPNKLPAEEIILTFNFAPGLPTGITLTGTPAVTVTVASGTDPDPSALLNGSAGFDSTSTLVLQPITGGLNGVSYLFDVQVATTYSDIKLELQGILPVSY